MTRKVWKYQNWKDVYLPIPGDIAFSFNKLYHAGTVNFKHNTGPGPIIAIFFLVFVR